MTRQIEIKATLAFVLSAACRELFEERTLVVDHSLSDGYYCHFGKGDRAQPEDVNRISETMRNFLRGDIEIELIEQTKGELAARFSRQRRQDKLAILDAWGADPVTCTRFGDHIDYRFEPITPDKSELQQFEVIPYDVGFLLRFPTLEASGEFTPFKDAPKLYQIVKEHEEWGSILGVSDIGGLNRLVQSGDIPEMIWVAEGLHEKKISQIADGLCADFPKERVIFISGPSASGKTTFSKRLGIQLKVNGFSTWPISMDNYYLDHDQMPEDETGRRKFETIAALDVNLICEHVNRLSEGKSIPQRRFSFSKGEGYNTGELIELPQNTFVIFEGIHGLNPVFAEQIGRERIQRIYVSAITQLNVDNEHRVSTSDNRLLRRLVRDEKFRGYSAEDTLTRWPHVRSGEEENIFPYQEEADFMFNSSLVYEIPVLAGQADDLLKQVESGSDSFPTAKRLLTFLSFFVQIPSRQIPATSILREFIGGSGFIDN